MDEHQPISSICFTGMLSCKLEANLQAYYSYYSRWTMYLMTCSSEVTVTVIVRVHSFSFVLLFVMANTCMCRHAVCVWIMR